MFSVELSSPLASSLSATEAQDLVAAFKWWKLPEQKVQREFSSAMFGRDVYNFKPLIGAKPNQLWHCHMQPKNSPEELARWMTRYKHRSPKKSNRILFYAIDGDKYLLIDIVDDPDGHVMMDGATEKDRNRLKAIGRAAQEFIDRR